MNTNEIIRALDAEISRLQQLRSAVAGLGATEKRAGAPEKKRPGRPKGSTNKPSPPISPKRGRMSPEGRARIAAAQRERWAKLRTPAKKTAKKSAPVEKTTPKKPSQRTTPAKKAPSAKKVAPKPLPPPPEPPTTAS